MALDLQLSTEPPAPFRNPKKNLGDLKSGLAAEVIATASDLALIVEPDGTVLDIAVGNEEISYNDFAGWIGRSLKETVTIESRPKIDELLRQANAGATTRWRQVNHPSPGGSDLPVRYAAIRIKDSGRILVLGRELTSLAAMQQRMVEAQISMELDYAKLRHSETRYRLLFHIASEGLLIVNAANRKVVEANPAAGRVLDEDVKRLNGRVLGDIFSLDSLNGVLAMLTAVRSTGRSDMVEAELAATGEAVQVSASIYRQENDSFYLMRVSSAGLEADAAGRGAQDAFMAAIQRMPDAFVVTDQDRCIEAANTALLDLAQLASEEQALGEPLDRWLGRAGIDVNVLVANLRKHGAISRFATIMTGDYGSEESVEVAGVTIEGDDRSGFGFSIRKVDRRVRFEATGGDLPRSVSQLTELVGRVSLKDLVRETTDVIERLCIETALGLTGDNRASAAEMLGLSRQSLYSKLRRYGLGDLDGHDDRQL